MTNSIYFTIPGTVLGGSSPADDVTINADRNASIQTQPRVKRATFGDGYEQRLADGINSLNRTVTLTFSPRDNTEIDDIITYFDYLNAVDPITITYNNCNGNETMKVIIDNWTKTFINSTASGAQASGRRIFEA
jgi:phage-related protein